MEFLKNSLKKSIEITLFLIKVTVPISLVIKVLSDFGLIKIIAGFFSPVMKIVGLSGELGIVWITAMLTNIYGGIITLFNFSNTIDFSVKEITIVATMILIAHSLFPETRILMEVGAKGKKVVGLRIISAIVIGFIMNIIYSSLGIYNEITKFKFVPKNTDNSYLGFFISQSKNYLNVFIIIFALLIFMEILKKVGLISLINKMLRPLLKPLGIGENAITINLVSLTMGISYGAALFFEEIKSGKITKQELTNSIYLMSLCHALIEDTLLMLSLGAKISGIILIRIIFTYIFIYGFNNYMKRKSVLIAQNN